MSPRQLDPAHRQAAHRIRFEWGPVGAATLEDVEYAVVVDVLSFTTTLSVAVSRGIAVYPFPWRDSRAVDFATSVDAELAVGRSVAARSGGISLSPVSVAAAEGVSRLVLPSPNGSTISASLASSGATVVGASLRNAPVVAAWLVGRSPCSVAVIAAGERWPDGSLRPAVEDLWGTGAVIAGLASLGGLSAEARVAAAAFAAVRDDLPASLEGCASGQELIAGGYASDVRMAGEYAADSVVPVLRDGCFTAA